MCLPLLRKLPGVYQQFPFRNSQLLRSWHDSLLPLCPVRSLGRVAFLSCHSALATRLKSFIFTPFQTLLHSSKTQPFCFHAIPNSLRKTPGGGYPLALFTGKNGEASDAVVEGHTSNCDRRHTARESLGSAILSTPEEPPCWSPSRVSY